MAEPSDEFVSRIAAEAAREALAGHRAIDQTQLSNIALAAAKEAVRETHAELFALLGINIADFDHVNRFRENLSFLNSLNTEVRKKDLTFLNSLHVNAASAGKRVTLTVISGLVGMLLLALAIGIVQMVQHPPLPPPGAMK